MQISQNKLKLQEYLLQIKKKRRKELMYQLIKDGLTTNEAMKTNYHNFSPANYSHHHSSGSLEIPLWVGILIIALLLIILALAFIWAAKTTEKKLPKPLSELHAEVIGKGNLLFIYGMSRKIVRDTADQHFKDGNRKELSAMNKRLDDELKKRRIEFDIHATRKMYVNDIGNQPDKMSGM